MIMAKKPILTDEALDDGVPAAALGRSVGATRNVDAPAPPSVTRVVVDAATTPERDVQGHEVPGRDVLGQDAPGRDASGNMRPKTRIHGYGDAPASDAPAIVPVVGWLVVTEGPGRGAAMALISGMNAVGRGDGNAVQIDFGDRAISREAHAYVIYDNEMRTFHVSHGGKTNLVRLNDAPVLAAEPLSHGDTLRIGATSLRFVALCGADFDWSVP